MELKFFAYMDGDTSIIVKLPWSANSAVDGFMANASSTHHRIRGSSPISNRRLSETVSFPGCSAFNPDHLSYRLQCFS